MPIDHSGDNGLSDADSIGAESGEILNAVLGTLRDLNEEWQKDELSAISIDTILFGRGGNLDSLSLVMLIAELEMRISEEFGFDIVIADERAMSQRMSPFRTVRSLVSYIASLVSEEMQK